MKKLEGGSQAGEEGRPADVEQGASNEGDTPADSSEPAFWEEDVAIGGEGGNGDGEENGGGDDGDDDNGDDEGGDGIRAARSFDTEESFLEVDSEDSDAWSSDDDDDSDGDDASYEDSPDGQDSRRRRRRRRNEGDSSPAPLVGPVIS